MEKYVNEMLENLLSLLKIETLQTEPSEGAPFGEGNRKALDYLLSLCQSYGWRTCNLDGYCGWAEVGEGELFGITVHLDVVPYGEGWLYSPLGEVTEQNGEKVIYGRGTIDDKGPAIASVFALRSLLESGAVPKKRIRIIFCCNEESGWECIEYYKCHAEIPSFSISPDADFPVIRSEKRVIRGDITIAKPETVDYIQAGSFFANIVPNRAAARLNTISDVTVMYALHHGLKLKKEEGKYLLTAEGVAAHGSTPQLGDNALSKILNGIMTLSPELTAAALTLTDYTGKGCGLDVADKSGALTLNLGVAKTEGDTISFSLDIRCPVTYSADFVSDKLKAAFPDAKVEIAEFHGPVYFEESDPLVQTLLSAYNDVTGENATPALIGGATFARAFPNSVAFGPVFPDSEGLAHQANERVTLKEFVKSAEIYKEAIKRLAF